MCFDIIFLIISGFLFAVCALFLFLRMLFKPQEYLNNNWEIWVVIFMVVQAVAILLWVFTGFNVC
jgi:heme/copper-type cytochrome/quinol oxidase subunit 4